MRGSSRQLVAFGNIRITLAKNIAQTESVSRFSRKCSRIWKRLDDYGEIQISKNFLIFAKTEKRHFGLALLASLSFVVPTGSLAFRSL